MAEGSVQSHCTVSHTFTRILHFSDGNLYKYWSPFVLHRRLARQRMTKLNIGEHLLPPAD